VLKYEHHQCLGILDCTAVFGKLFKYVDGAICYNTENTELWQTAGYRICDDGIYRASIASRGKN